MDQNDLVNILYDKQDGRITKIHLNEILDQFFQILSESLKRVKKSKFIILDLSLHQIQYINQSLPLSKRNPNNGIRCSF